MKWGRDELEWEELVEETGRFLAERARMERTTSYTELNAVLHRRTGAASFDFGLDRDRAAMGALLGEVATQMYGEVGALVSSIVIYLNENDAGTGFYGLARELGLLPSKTTGDQRVTFWAQQVKATFDHFRRVV